MSVIKDNNLCKIVLYIHMIKYVLNNLPNKCGKFYTLREYFPDDLGKNSTLDFHQNNDFMQCCTNKGTEENKCHTDLDKITAGFLWLLAEYYSMSQNGKYNENNTNPFFLYMISWFSYKIKQKSNHETTSINDYYNNHVKNSDKYIGFTKDAYKFTYLEDVLDKKSDFLNINIEDLSKFYDVFKLLCNIHSNLAQNKTNDILSNSATSFVNKLTELNNNSKIEDTVRNKILPVLSTDYDNLKNNCTSKGDKCKDFPPIPETIPNIYAQKSGVTSSSSSTANKLFTVLSIFGAIAFFLGISYKVNNKELKNITFKYYFHYIYANANKKNTRFLTFYISIRYLDFGNELKNNI
ncbi:putative yir2 protein [Plasmodium yoelii yoelii]|uniref:Yir2 protein n=1 Tax=Plasmodium yoelii yoelii TaxID=73239 RepID=Q7RGN6_PLAYO|nr:putative yir2 protein [Plasmodium yoelii yoelii]